MDMFKGLQETMSKELMEVIKKYHQMENVKKG